MRGNKLHIRTDVNWGGKGGKRVKKREEKRRERDLNVLLHKLICLSSSFQQWIWCTLFGNLFHALRVSNHLPKRRWQVTRWHIHGNHLDTSFTLKREGERVNVNWMQCKRGKKWSESKSCPKVLPIQLLFHPQYNKGAHLCLTHPHPPSMLSRMLDRCIWKKGEKHFK